MEVTSSSFSDGATIPDGCAFCVPDPDTHATFGPNRNPHLAWSGVPDNTRSLVVVCHDPDVPSRPDDVNKDDREVPPDLARTDFFHWVLVDLPPDLTSIEPGMVSDGVVAHGKSADAARLGRAGINDYTGWFAGDAAMEGEYYGYDGPCPPWNDSLVHRYIFTVYATDLDRCPVEGAFTGVEVLGALEGHILDRADVMGTYTLNPRLRPD